MNSAEGLPTEDRADFVRLLDEALRTARLTTGADPVHIERLRARAIEELPAIAAAAAGEHERLVRLRGELGQAPPAAAAGPGEAGGGGAALVFFALVPVLSGIAGAVFLLLGYVLGLADPEPAMAEPMRTVGWVFAAVAGVGAVLAAAGLVVAAARNGATSIRASVPGDQVLRAREEWRRALLERGIGPFVRQHVTPAAHQGRVPRLRFTSPQFSSPEFSSRAEGTEQAHRPGYAGPDYAGPDYAGPDFTSPAEGGAETP